LSKDIKKLVNPNRHINRNTLMSNLNGKSFEEIIDVFNKRVYDFYFKLGDHIVAQKHPHFDFVLMIISVVTIDLLSQYENNLDSSGGKHFRAYIRVHIPEFNKKFINKGTLEFFFKDRKKRVHWSEPVNSKYLNDYADAFYLGFRNGIVHNAMILPFGRINWSPKNIVQEELWDKKNNKIEIIIHPQNLYHKIKLIFNDYIKRLKNPKETKLRDKFREKFLRDFGWSI